MTRQEFEKANEMNIVEDFPKGSKVLYWTSPDARCYFPNEHQQKFEELDSVEDDGLVVILDSKKVKVSYDLVVGLEDPKGMLHECEDDELFGDDEE